MAVKAVSRFFFGLPERKVPVLLARSRGHAAMVQLSPNMAPIPKRVEPTNLTARTPWAVWILSLALMPVFAVPLVASERELAQAHQNLDSLRGIQLPKGPNDKESIATLNKKMDAAWSYFESHKDTLPMVKQELEKELTVKEPDQFFLLDVGNLLVVYEGDKAVSLALSALERIDPRAEIIRSNWEELFHFVIVLTTRS